MVTAVIGGGASGMTAAYIAAERSDSVILFEKQPRVGKKLLATGNGRCNLSNKDLSLSHYHGNSPEFCAFALKHFGLEKTAGFFRSLGLVISSEADGRIFPYSGHANSVVDILRLAVKAKGVNVLCGTEVLAVSKTSSVFTITCADKKYTADNVIVATGGAAGTRYGGSVSGYEIMKGLGHTVTKLTPSLVQLRTENTYTRSLKGVRADACVRLIDNKRVRAESRGEVQFTDYGISGPAVFDISRAAARTSAAVVSLDMMEDFTKEDIVCLLETKKICFKEEKLDELLTGILHNRLGRTLLRYCGYSLEDDIASLSSDDFEDIADGIKRFELPLLGNMGMDGAQVTAGGLSTEEFSPETLQSRKVKGLFAAGEVLDIDGDCGGYNLQWAWSSGMLAGRLGEPV